ncbi:metal-dependent phosphohydrolase, HD subdomain protein [Rugosimonospora africana]|uniref:Metal-dependent phosphohydrolase, HD subdomain protein n=1 Tax=Rugosimonospora africana TaxID=556532 RepID=A0A8J3QRT6_9ACTN|nr:metal-dependent phosphohydrolase, HD subdomain protein [Rugosimonospora africana]
MAQALAEELLGGCGDRWRHTIGVAHRAEELSATVEPGERDALVVAAWLHDIGYSPAALDTGFHPLDGARYLDRHGWPRRIVALVAHHSGAEPVAAVRGLGEQLNSYPDERSLVTDALAYADQTVGPQGQRLPIRQRLAEALARHGAGSPQARAHAVREPRLLAIAERVERRLAELVSAQAPSSQAADNRRATPR